LIVALLMFIIAVPIFLLVFILIWFSIGTPVFFKQERSGRDMKTFHILKFRTMRVKKDDAEKDADRMTKVGYFLRKTSLDELPQLLNIINGDMSFIGPRPERKVFVDQLDKMKPHWLRNSRFFGAFFFCQ